MNACRPFASARSALGSILERLAQYVNRGHCTKVHKISASLGLDQKDHRVELVARLRGQTIVIPDVGYIYAGWPVRVNPEVNACREYLEEWFSKYIPTVKQRNKQRKVNSALCAGHFWTAAPAEKFFMLGSLMAFFFFWDDEIDCGTLTNDDAKTEAYCDDTIAFLRHHLQPELKTTLPAPGRMHNAGAFVDIGSAVQAGQSLEARDRFAESLYDYIKAVRLSQAKWLVGVTTLDDYVERRSNTVGTKPCITVMQWAYGISLPSSVWNHIAMQALIREVGMSVCLYNDLASLKKEVAEGDVDSAVPILVWNEGLTPQKAVNRITGMIEQSWVRLLDAERRLLATGETQQMNRDLETLVGGCKDIVVGHVAYSLKAARYMAGSKLNGQDNSVRVVL